MNIERPTFNNFLEKSNVPGSPINEERFPTLNSIVRKIDQTPTTDDYGIGEKLLVATYCLYAQDPEFAIDFLRSLGFENPQDVLYTVQDDVIGRYNINGSERNTIELEVVRIAYADDNGISTKTHNDADDTAKTIQIKITPLGRELKELERRIIELRQTDMTTVEICQKLNIMLPSYNNICSKLSKAGLISPRPIVSKTRAQKMGEFRRQIEELLLSLLAESQKPTNKTLAEIASERLGRTVKEGRISEALRRLGYAQPDTKRKRNM